MNYYRKYIILAILGSLIIGMASYLFLNNYLDRKEILVAARYIEDGKKIDENDICVKEYYKDSLPEGYLTRKEDVIGKIINLPRRKDDYISIDMLLEKPEEGIFSGLGEDEVVLSINLEYFEPLLRGLGPGKYISIVSTEKEDDLTSGSLAGYVDYIRGDGYREYDGYSEYEGRDESYSNYESDNSTDTRNNTRYRYNGGQGVETWGSYDYQENYLDATTYKLSDNVLLVDGQLIIRNLELVGIEENEFYSGSALITGDQSLITIYIKCDLKEAPLVARLTSEGKYRIMVESL